jgi:hypothetical protein
VKKVTEMVTNDNQLTVWKETVELNMNKDTERFILTKYLNMKVCAKVPKSTISKQTN